MDYARKPQWLSSVLFVSLTIDTANLFRLVRGSVPLPLLVPWIATDLLTVWLTTRKRDRPTWRLMLWIVLSVAVLELSVLSDGTNVSLWVYLALMMGHMSAMPIRQILAILFGVAHIATQLLLLPPGAHNAIISYPHN